MVFLQNDFENKVQYVAGSVCPAMAGSESNFREDKPFHVQPVPGMKFMAIAYFYLPHKFLYYDFLALLMLASNNRNILNHYYC